MKVVHHAGVSHLFIRRVIRSIVIGTVMIIAALLIGMLGYHFFEGMSWIDAFVNASMILSGMGPMGTLNTASGKLFAGFYALFSGLLFILIVGIIFGPIAHRFFIRWHIEDKRDE